MRIRGADFVAICVPDGRMDEAKAFYGGVLGLPAAGISAEGWTEYEAGGLTIALDSEPFLPPDSGRAPEGAVRIALAVDGLEAAVADLRRKGVEPAFGPEEFDPCFMAAIRDPFGNLVLLHERKDGTAG